MPEECNIVRNHEGFLVNSCTGEVLGFDNFSTDDFSKLEYYERVSSPKKSKPGSSRKGVKGIRKIVMDYLLSVMDEDEKDKFYKILNKIKKYKKPDLALLLAIYEYVMAKEGKTLNREYTKFLKLKGKGTGKYAIRQRKKFLRKILKEDPVLDFIDSLEPEKKGEALKLYDALKEKGLVNGKAKTRKKVLIEYINDYNKKKEVLETESAEGLIRWDLNYVTIV